MTVTEAIGWCLIYAVIMADIAWRAVHHYGLWEVVW